MIIQRARDQQDEAYYCPGPESQRGGITVPVTVTGQDSRPPPGRTQCPLTPTEQIGGPVSTGPEPRVVSELS